MTRSFYPLFALCLIALPAFSAHAEMDTVEATCISRNVADAGYGLTVTQTDTGETLLALEEITFFGSQPVGTFRVVMKEIVSHAVRVYTGKGIGLAIDLSGADSNGRFNAILSGASLPSDQFTDLSCEVRDPKIAEPLPAEEPGRFTCMAFWMGAVFNPATGSCEKHGASGCSNPFEFKSVAACEKAFTVRK